MLDCSYKHFGGRNVRLHQIRSHSAAENILIEKEISLGFQLPTK
jgi:hypothetical protein